MKVWLIQNIISPYRIKLFQKLAETPGVKFKVVLLARRMKNKPQWDFQLADMPFPVERVPGICFHTSYEKIICLSPLLLLKLLRERPDVIICAGFSFATLMAVLHKFLGGSKYVIWMEGTRYTETSRVRHLLRGPLLRLASALVDAGTLSREYMQSLLPKSQNKAFFTSYNCVETDRFSLDQTSPDELAEFRKRYPGKNILFVGQLVERKGIWPLLELYKNLLTYLGADLRLFIIGQGPLHRAIDEFKQQNGLDKIVLTGFLPNTDIPKYYWISDLFVLLSLQDPNPLVVFEALTAGVPILCSNRAGNAVDFIVEGVNGYVVDPYDMGNTVEKASSILRWDEEVKEEARRVSGLKVRRANYDESAKAFIDACKHSLGIC